MSDRVKVINELIGKRRSKAKTNAHKKKNSNEKKKYENPLCVGRKLLDKFAALT